MLYTEYVVDVAEDEELFWGGKEVCCWCPVKELVLGGAFIALGALLAADDKDIQETEALISRNIVSLFLTKVSVCD